MKTFAQPRLIGAALLALAIGAAPAPANTAEPAAPEAQPAAPPSQAAPAVQPAVLQTLAVQPVVTAAQAASRVAPAVAEIFSGARSLDPGEFVWHPELATSGDVEIVVSIPQQRAYVYRGATLIAVSTVSTGRPGHSTPTGRFPILEKHREHYSNRYNNAPMPYMQRLTMDGVALHAGQIPGRPASHGCVRLPLAFARNLFGVTQVGAVVHITNSAATPETALTLARAEQPAVTAPGRIQLASRTN